MDKLLKRAVGSPLIMNSLHSYHRQVTHNKTQAKPNHFIGHHRVLDEIQTTGAINKPSRRIWKENKEEEIQKKREKISFSHRAVAMRITQPGFNAASEREKQIEINKLTNYFVPKVYKLSPSQISQSIIMRSKLAKFLPKKDLQPQLYPKTSIIMQKQLHLLKPCENYNKSRNVYQALGQEKNVTTPRQNLNQLKQREKETIQFSGTRTPENTPWSRSGFSSTALPTEKQKVEPNKEVMSPFNNILRYAKKLANAVKS
ncbi:uncharacterized protein [Halyomorpha halys]|uniref:uncharacterized protein isoform X1 n=1 Tax=Halyomorpha halys TaxID=286706 RepID=UPI0006D4EB62|nr:uncharacterized protein LOC106692593 isoform X2 [Halyomorpha halys]